MVVLAASVLLIPRFSGAKDGVSRLANQVFISELHYHDLSNLDTEDFFEITNNGTSDVALTRWCLKGVDFCFTEKTVLRGGEVIVVTGKDFAGTLANSGEPLQLIDSVDNVVDEVQYATQKPWAESADGRGHSLHRLTADPLVSVPLQWMADVPSPGIKYDADFRKQLNDSASVVMTEIHYHPANDNPAEEFVEVTNISSAQVSLSGWCMPEVNFCFAATDVLGPNESRTVSGFSEQPLSNGNAVVQLLDAAKKKQDVVYFEDNNQWPATADGYGMSLHRRNGRLWGTEPGNWEAATPSPGITTAASEKQYLSTFDDVAFTKSPLPSQEVEVTASMRDGDAAMLHYKLNFEPEVKTPMVGGSNGRWVAAIPVQPAGTLIRFRVSNAGSVDRGSWPRAGDGMSYRGTVVESEKESQLPQLSWFVKDAYYERIYNDRDLYGDNGYPTVIAFDGEVFDRAMIRIKGNQSRLNQKRKWKVVLPAGYETNLGGLLKEPVNEFALNSAVTDKSFMREILTSELQQLGGGIGQQVFPLRFEKNNEFYGLYLYQEQPDGRWREKFGFSDSATSFKSDRQATLNLNQLDFPDSEMRGRYQRRTQRWLKHVDEVRELISQVNNDNKDEVLSFVYTHVDVPQVIEAIATMRVAQHLEWEHKNHLLLVDPADKKWRLVPIDFDLNFGRRVAAGCNSLCEEVSASSYMSYMEGNRLGRLFLKTPELREMLDRRTRTLADQFLKEGFVEDRLKYWEPLLRDDAQRDRKIWYTYGEQYSMQKGQDVLLNQYFIPKRDLLIGAESKLLPPMQKDIVAYALTGELVVTISNSESVAIDISGVKLPSLNSQVPAGTVLGPGKSALFSLDRLPTSPLEKGQMHIWVRPL
jgi:hypothetical protein